MGRAMSVGARNVEPVTTTEQTALVRSPSVSDGDPVLPPGREPVDWRRLRRPATWFCLAASFTAAVGSSLGSVVAGLLAREGYDVLGVTPLTMEGYLQARMIRDPLCMLDMDVPVDGADAFSFTPYLPTAK